MTIAGVEFEGDTAPRPGGDKTLSVIDWVQLGRYVAALDTIDNPSEFQRADCAPRTTKGNGALTVSDWVQGGRYAIGLDPLTPVGGPTNGPAAASVGGLPQPPPAGSKRVLRLLSWNPQPGQTNSASVMLEAQGNENALALSLAFDPTQLRWLATTAGTGATQAFLNLNANEASLGRVGVALALPPGDTLAAGTKEIVKLNFLVLQAAPVTPTISFSDQPIRREIADALAVPLDTIYAGSSTIPHLAFTKSNETLLFSWPAADGFDLEQTTEGLGSPWIPVTGAIVVGDQKILEVSVGTGERFFRLKRR